MRLIINDISIKQAVLYAAIVIVLLNLPFFFLGADFYPGFGYDNLDSNIVNNKIVKDSQAYFMPNTYIIEQPLGGLPRSVFGSDFSMIRLLYFLFSVPIAYVINVMLIQIIAFVGMVLLLKTEYKSNSNFIVFGVALIYSQLNFWPNAGISLAGIPLLLYAYLIWQHKKVAALLIILFYTLYSSFALTGIFLIGLWVLFIFYKIFTKQHFGRDIYFCGLIILFYLLKEHRLVLSVINPDFISHRSEIIRSGNGFAQSFQMFIKIVFSEFGHNVKFPVLIIASVVILFLFVKSAKIKWLMQIYIMTGIIFVIAILSSLMQSHFGLELSSNLGFLKMVQLQRFYWLLPPLFYFLFYIALDSLWSANKKLLVIFLLFVQFGLVSSKNTNWRQLIKTEILKQEAGVLSFSAFYSPGLYNQVKDYIETEQKEYRVASIGLHPAASLYNGFYTIDGYFSNNYPLEYKHTFAKIMQAELDKNEKAFDFYHGWGSVVVILPDEMVQRFGDRGFVVPAFRKTEGNLVINNLNLNTTVLKELNCQYIFSAFKIENPERTGLVFLKYFENEESPWGIFLYQVNGTSNKL
jgi:hypothetical protein